MAKRYYVSTYRPVVCSNTECERYGKIIPINQNCVRDAEVGECWRTFCSCGDGAGWRLDKVEWDDSIRVDEVELTIKIQLGAEKAAGPFWRHGCSDCVYLGSFMFGDDYKADYYVCDAGDSSSPDMRYSGTIRHGHVEDDDEYDSFCETHLWRTIKTWKAGEFSVCGMLKKLMLKHFE